MLLGILARATNANDLKDALDLSAQRTRAIAGRVAQASVNGAERIRVADRSGDGQADAGRRSRISKPR